MPKKQPAKSSVQSFYRESIPLEHKFLWILLILEILFFATIAYRQMVLDIPFGPWPIKNWGLLLITLLMLLPIAILFFVRLKIQVNTQGIRYRLVPIEFKSKLLDAGDIDHFEISKSHPKNSRSPKDKGIKITTTSGKSILLPTRNSQALYQAMHRMMKHAQQLPK